MKLVLSILALLSLPAMASPSSVAVVVGGEVYSCTKGAGGGATYCQCQKNSQGYYAVALFSGQDREALTSYSYNLSDCVSKIKNFELCR